jgi:hypothetical protein
MPYANKREGRDLRAQVGSHFGQLHAGEPMGCSSRLQLHDAVTTGARNGSGRERHHSTVRLVSMPWARWN